MTTLMKKTNGNVPATTFSGLVDTLFRNNLDRLFDDNFWGFSGLDRSVSVPVNIKDTGTALEIHLIAPGLQRDDFNVNLSGDLLTVSFEQSDNRNTQDTAEGWLRKEYKTQSFSRTFTLDDSVELNKVAAKYSDGILCITLPKKEDAQKLSRNIEIS
ncbi:MAG: hypothetical protein BGO69_11715 [Bacteroidetes bacterium 46-16]|nr:MAG: hypothetical protein BGO69_11715 [Bacteroidetes bacterium 46-16]